MNILIFSPFFMPAFRAGGPIRSISNVTSACKYDFDFYVVTRDRDLGDEHSFNYVEFSRWSFINKIKVFYSKPEDLTSRKYLQHISDTSPHLIYLNSLWDIQFSFKIVIMHRFGGLKNNNILLAPRGELSKGALSIKPYKKRIALRLMKAFGLYNDVFFHATSREEVEEVHKQLNVPYGKILLAKNIPSIPSIPSVVCNENWCKSSVLKLVFISRISEKKNLKFALEVLDKIDFEVVFDIYGPIEDLGYWGECEKLIKILPGHVKVNYQGELLPSEVSSTFGKYHGFIFPTLGENYGHVIVESLLAGTPILLSDQTPWKNLGVYGLGYSLPLDLGLFVNALNDFYMSIQIEESCGRLERIQSAKKLVGYDESVQQIKDMFNLVGME